MGLLSLKMSLKLLIFLIVAGVVFGEDQAIGEVQPVGEVQGDGGEELRQMIQLRIDNSDHGMNRIIGNLANLSQLQPCSSFHGKKCHSIPKPQRDELLERGRNDTQTLVRVTITFHLTPLFRNQFSTAVDMAFQIQRIVDRANEGFANSRIPILLIIHSVLNSTIIENPQGTFSALFTTFLQSAETIDELRNHADIAILLSGTYSYGGVFTQQGTTSNLEEACIFDGVSSDLTLGIIPITFFQSNDYCNNRFLLGRCIATIFGANLDRANSPLDSLVSPYHGYRQMNPFIPYRGFRTICTTTTQGQNPTPTPFSFNYLEWINYYSNPDVSVGGIPTGDANNDNARLLTQRRFLMAFVGNEIHTSYRHDFDRLLILSDSSMEIIDVRTNQPVCTSTLPFSFLGGFGGLDYDNQPIVCGEFRSGYTKRDCYVLQKKGNFWEKSMAQLPGNTAMIGHASFDSKIFGRGRIVALANTDGNVSGMDKIQYFSPQGWILSRASLPFRTTGACVSNLNSTSVLILPGYEPTLGSSNRTFIYDFISDQLFMGPDRPIASQSISCARMTNATTGHSSIIVAGGQLANGTIDRSSYILDLERGVWMNGPQLPTPIFGGQLIEHPSGGVTYISDERFGSSVESTSKMFFLQSVNTPWMQMIQLQNDCSPFNIAIPVPSYVGCSVPAPASTSFTTIPPGLV